MPYATIIKNKIDLEKVVSELIEKASTKGGGALVTFIGYVKGEVDGKKVHSLLYEAYEPYATKKLLEIAKEESNREGVIDVQIYHRIGELKPGDISIYIFVTSKSRAEGFETARRVLERVKKEVPIFKLEKREDGEYWIVGDKKRIRKLQG